MYKLNKPYTDAQKANFIVQYNHQLGLTVEETSKALYALEPWEGVNEQGEVVDNKEAWEAEQAQKEAERIAHLKLTRGDVFRGLLMARQVTRAMLRAQLEALPEETPEQQITKEMALIDFDEALDFYRGNALIDTVGEALGISKEQLDKFFETNDYTVLLPPVEEPAKNDQVTDQVENIETKEEVNEDDNTTDTTTTA